MSMLVIVLASAAILSVAYWTYGPILVRLLRLDATVKTPAFELRDDLDYAPLAPNELLSQHFSAIAAAGPIVGPILAGGLVRLASRTGLDPRRFDFHRRCARHYVARGVHSP